MCSDLNCLLDVSLVVKLKNNETEITFYDLFHLLGNNQDNKAVINFHFLTFLHNLTTCQQSSHYSCLDFSLAGINNATQQLEEAQLANS